MSKNKARKGKRVQSADKSRNFQPGTVIDTPPITMSQQTNMAAPMGAQSATLLIQTRDVLYGEQNINGTLNGTLNSQMSNITQDSIHTNDTYGPPLQHPGQYMQPMYKTGVTECQKVNLVPEIDQQSQQNTNMNMNMNRTPSSVLNDEQCKQSVYTASSITKTRLFKY